MVVGYVAFRGQERTRSARALFFLIFSSVLMLATFKSRRFVEYWPPFAILFAAFSLQSVFDGARGLVGTLPAEVLDELQPFLDKQEQAEAAKADERNELWKTIAACIVALALFAVLMANIIGVKREIASSDPPDKYRAGMKWVSENVPAGERVFNTDWDDFPRMFFFDLGHAYISGLDPTYLLDKNQELSQLYDDVTLGHRDDPAQVIRDRFGARYVFSDQEEIHDEFYAKAMNSGWFDKVYEDDDCFILHIRDRQGEPPPESADDNSSADEQGADANDNEADLPEENGAP
jgi:hypothetical protein